MEGATRPEFDGATRRGATTERRKSGFGESDLAVTSVMYKGRFAALTRVLRGSSPKLTDPLALLTPAHWSLRSVGCSLVATLGSLHLSLPLVPAPFSLTGGAPFWGGGKVMTWNHNELTGNHCRRAAEWWYGGAWKKSSKKNYSSWLSSSIQKWRLTLTGNMLQFSLKWTTGIYSWCRGGRGTLPSRMWRLLTRCMLFNC